MRIYIADLKDYNNGNLVGKWFNLEDYTDHEELSEAVHEMLKERSGVTNELHEEWAIHDYEAEEADSESLQGLVSEYESFETLFKLHEFINNDDFEGDENTRLSWLRGSGFSLHDNDLQELEGYFSEAFCGEYESMEDYAYELVESGSFGDIREGIKSYIDYEKIARDLSYDGYTEAHGYIFRAI